VPPDSVLAYLNALYEVEWDHSTKPFSDFARELSEACPPVFGPDFVIRCLDLPNPKSFLIRLRSDKKVVEEQLKKKDAKKKIKILVVGTKNSGKVSHLCVPADAG